MARWRAAGRTPPHVFARRLLHTHTHTHTHRSSPVARRPSASDQPHHPRRSSCCRRAPGPRLPAVCAECIFWRRPPATWRTSERVRPRRFPCDPSPRRHGAHIYMSRAVRQGLISSSGRQLRPGSMFQRTLSRPSLHSRASALNTNIQTSHASRLTCYQSTNTYAIEHLASRISRLASP